MTRKDCKAIAMTLRDMLDMYESACSRAVVAFAISRLCDICADGNDQFDRAHFLRACGLEG